jgi:integrase
MKQKIRNKRKLLTPKTILRLPDLEVAKSAVLNSLSCPDAQRGYRHAIDEFVDWYCSEPRLSFSKTVVVRYRMHLESRKLAPHDLRRSCARLCRAAGGELEQIRFLLGHVSVQTIERYLGLHPTNFIRRQRPHRHRAETMSGQLWKGANDTDNPRSCQVEAVTAPRTVII